MAAAAACASCTNCAGGNKARVTDRTKEFRHNSSSVCSISIRPPKTQASISLNSGTYFRDDSEIFWIDSAISGRLTHQPIPLHTHDGIGESQGDQTEGAWCLSSSRSIQPLLFHDGVQKSVIHRTSAMVTSTGTEISGGNVTIKKLEEEVWDGCSLQHGEMSADGVRIHVVEAGDPAGKLVVLLHGFPNFWFVWRNQFKPLVEAGYHVIAPDLRGYNLSSKFETVQDYGRSAVLPDIEKLIDNFGTGKPAIVVGHDWGAIIAWAFTEDYPSKVEKLLTTNMGRLSDFQKVLRSNSRQIVKSWYIGLFQVSFIPERYFISLILHLVKNLKTAAPGATDEDIRRSVEVCSRPGNVIGGISYYRAAVQGLWSRPDGTVPVVSVPVTCLWGDLDAYILPVVAETDKERAPNFKLVHLPKSGHWPMWDEHAFNDILLNTIAEDGKESE